MPLLKTVQSSHLHHQPAVAGEGERVDILVRQIIGQSYPSRDQVEWACHSPEQACLITYERASGLPRAVTILDVSSGRVLHLAALCAQERDALLDYARIFASRYDVELDCSDDLYRDGIK